MRQHSSTWQTDQDPAKLFFYPSYQPQQTWGMGNRAAYTPGPGGPLRDPRRRTNIAPGPVYGRVGALSCLRAFGPGNLFNPINPFPQQSVNDSYATALVALFVPGWYKPNPSAVSGF